MIESIIVLWCIPLNDHRERNFTELTQYANELRIPHYPEEHMFDVSGDYKGHEEDCYWVSIPPED